MVTGMVDLSPEQASAIQVAHDLVDMGVPLFSAPPHSSGEFALPDAWQTFRPNHVQVDRWKPGWALAMVTGVVFDVLDVDPRNGGDEGWSELTAADAVPYIFGQAATPSSGLHFLIPRTHLAKTSKAAKGVDLQAGDDRGEGRGFIYLAPTVRVSKFGPRQGETVAYRWIQEPGAPVGKELGEGMDNLRALVGLNRGPRRVATKAGTKTRALPSEDTDAFESASDFTADQAARMLDGQIDLVMTAQEGEVNSTLGGAARMFGRFMAGGYVTEEEATERLLHAVKLGGVHSDSWNVAHGKKWTAATVISAGLANGAEEPWTVELPPAAVETQPVDARTQSPTQPVALPASVPGATPRMRITSAAEQAYELQGMLGAGRLSGYFLRSGQVVHTPRVDDLGYVEPKAGADDNGPVQIQTVSAAQLAAKIQYAFYCYKEVDEKDSEGKKTGQKREVPALYPLEAAKRATDAPEAMVMLRSLAGVTETPMVRADGSILEAPGYDAATRFLFLPSQGVRVPAVPDVPTDAEVKDAVGLLETMTAGFPWGSADDRANYFGLLLTPMLRLVTPPTYKMFGITAHQPGSGKTLLADVARILHGGVLRSEMPTDEAEIGKMTTSVLATTSATVVHVDNVTGILRSSKLAGILTATGEMQERELGKTSNLTFTNDRVWVVTGNNLSLGGDLVRRTVVISIDPNMANPETRSFEISDLKAWTAAHRNELLWALLVLIRHWVAKGRPLADRKQSDSFATWEATVAGILEAAGVPGAFDAQSGQAAAAGGDDDGLGAVLERIWDMRGDKVWRAAEILSDTVSTELGDFVAESREWLPSPVLDKLARSEAAGRKTMGYWLRNRIGRWVSGSDGHSYVIRQAGVDKVSVWWRIERSA